MICHERNIKLNEELMLSCDGFLPFIIQQGLNTFSFKQVQILKAQKQTIYTQSRQMNTSALCPPLPPKKVKNQIEFT